VDHDGCEALQQGRRLFPLCGFNWSNSINNETMELTAQFRKDLGFEHVVRFEHHIVETWKSIVKQPYDRRAELVQIADHVANISAKHEGAMSTSSPRSPTPPISWTTSGKERSCGFRRLGGSEAQFPEEVEACNHTARALTEHGLSFRRGLEPAQIESGRERN